jgi:integrase
MSAWLRGRPAAFAEVWPTVSALPVLPEVVRAYRAYLDTYDLKGYDLAELPMVLPVRLGKKANSIQPTSRSYIWRIVKDAMQSAADLTMEAGDEIAQTRLQQASTHWLRHTFATDLFDSGADVLSVRDLMDYVSISTTSRYLHRPEERPRADLERLTRDNLLRAPVGSVSPTCGTVPSA